MSEFDPSKPSSAVAEMRAAAKVCRDLLGGTVGMRALGRVHLPQWPQEANEAWEARRDSTTLFPAFEKAIETMVGKPFDAPIVLGEDVPKALVSIAENIDNAGRDLDTFARDAFAEILADGIGWILVDHPPVTEGATLAQYNASGARPYWVFIPLSRMLGWKTTVVGGKPVLTQVRFEEVVETESGAFGTAEECRVKVWEPGMVTTYRKAEGEWVMVPEASGPVSIQEIPLVTLYTGRKGFLRAKPPLANLAWLNVTHWQSSSDQRNVLHVARVPFLAADEGPSDPGTVVIGPNGVVTGFKNLGYVEHTGKAIEAGEKDLDRLEDQMRRVAGELLASKVQKTATESSSEDRQGASWLKSRVWTFQDTMEEAFRLSALWIKEPAGGSVTIDTEWDEEQLAADMITALTNAHAGGTMSRSSAIWNFHRRGMLPPGRTVEDEIALIDAEGPSGLGPTIP